MRTSIIFFLFLLNINLFGQEYFLNEGDDEKKISKEEKKEQKRIDKAKQIEWITALVEARRFVLEANSLSNEKGEKVYVHSNLNFIKIDSMEAVVQIGSINGLGSNGLGGVTLDGKVAQYDVKYNERKNSYGIRVFITALGGPCDVYITINSLGNATATVTGLFPGYLMYQGNIESLQRSKVFKGRAF